MGIGEEDREVAEGERIRGAGGTPAANMLAGGGASSTVGGLLAGPGSWSPAFCPSPEGWHYPAFQTPVNPRSKQRQRRLWLRC